MKLVLFEFDVPFHFQKDFSKCVTRAKRTSNINLPDGLVTPLPLVETVSKQIRHCRNW